ncbi:MAG: hypothetical protein LBQ60_03690 [Bacteroidales bacterium]|nr:hypothetical protein [Bacteroidales bacterium]
MEKYKSFGKVLLFALLFSGAFSCTKDKEKDNSVGLYNFWAGTSPSEKITHLDMGSSTVGGLIISGGDGIYHIMSDNEEIVSAEINVENVVIIRAHKVGNAHLIVSDTNTSSSVSVSVTQRTEAYSVVHVGVVVEVEEPTSENKESIDQVKAEIRSKMNQVKTVYRFYYNDTDKGDLIIFPGGNQDEPVRAGFLTTRDHDDTFIHIEYNQGTSDLYQQRNLFENRYYMKDFTQEYQQRFPDLKITKAEGWEKIEWM